MDLRTAQDQLRVARALAELPMITEAFSQGRLSYSKVRALTRIATPGTEADWLNLAVSGTAAHVERAVRAARSATADPTDVAARREVSWSWAEDGSLMLRARLAPDDGAALIAVLDRFTDAAPGRGTVPGQPAGVAWKDWHAERTRLGIESAPGEALDRIGARRADALMAMTNAATADGQGVHTELVIHVDTEDGTAQVENGPALSRPTVERLGCNGHVSALLEDRRGNPLYLGRRRRVVTNRQLRALIGRDHGHCQFAGCASTHVEAHHIRHWLHGGMTDLDNLVLICRFHHGLVHDRGYTIGMIDGRIETRRPDGALVPNVPPIPGGSLDDLVEGYTHRRLTLGQPLHPRWAGEELDLDHFLAALLTPAPEPIAA